MPIKHYIFFSEKTIEILISYTFAIITCSEYITIKKENNDDDISNSSSHNSSGNCSNNSNNNKNKNSNSKLFDKHMPHTQTYFVKDIN